MSVFYPIGWDDNGLPTERRVQNVYGVRCDPSLPYDPGFVPPEQAGQGPRCRSPGGTSSSCASGSPRSTSAPSRRCGGGSGCRWTGRCSTPRSATTAGGCRSGRSCATWRAARRTGPRRRRCGTSRSRPRSPRPSSRTARPAARSTGSRSAAPDGSPVWVETTRPELLPACVALVAHPDDARYQALFGVDGADAGVRRARCRCSRTRWPSRTRGRGSRWCAPSAT